METGRKANQMNQPNYLNHIEGLENSNVVGNPESNNKY